jgi:S1-C subfamily serine protease
MRNFIVKITLFTFLTLSFLHYTHNRIVMQEKFVLNKARSSFIKIIVENEILITECTDSELLGGYCDDSRIASDGFQIFGSGIIIKNNDKNYILTADHICDQMIDGPVISPGGIKGVMLSSPYAMTIDGMLHKTDVEKRDTKNDICLLSFEDSEKFSALKITSDNIIPGERVYNISAPKGVFEPWNVLIFDGFYTGLTYSQNSSMMFSIYAEQGSSGSAVINEKGEIVSIIHSTLTLVDNVSIGANIEEIREFLKDE